MRMWGVNAPMRPRFLTLSTIAVATLALLATGAPVQASSGGCDNAALSQPFLPWYDASQYQLVPGGDFEAHSSDWSLGGDAQVVRGNETCQVNDPADSRALSLGAGGTATSGTVCLAVQDPTLLLFARNAASPLSLLAVSVQFTDPFGNQQSLPLTPVSAGPDWQPTMPIPVALNLLSLPLVSSGATDVTFTPVGPGGDWTIDDVYLDPFKTK